HPARAFDCHWHLFDKMVLNTATLPVLPPDIHVHGELITTWFAPRRRYQNKKHAGWLLINNLIINRRRLP
ncbi:hypothetical protein J4Y59_23375, partial [Escherichia coli]